MKMNLNNWTSYHSKKINNPLPMKLTAISNQILKRQMMNNLTKMRRVNKNFLKIPKIWSRIQMNQQEQMQLVKMLIRDLTKKCLLVS